MRLVEGGRGYGELGIHGALSAVGLYYLGSVWVIPRIFFDACGRVAWLFVHHEVLYPMVSLHRSLMLSVLHLLHR